MTAIKTPSQEQAAKKKIEYYQKIIAFDMMLHARLDKRVRLLLWVPFSGIRRIRMIIEMEAINNRIISRNKFLNMYSSRVDPSRDKVRNKQGSEIEISEEHGELKIDQ